METFLVFEKFAFITVFGIFITRTLILLLRKVRVIHLGGTKKTGRNLIEWLLIPMFLGWALVLGISLFTDITILSSGFFFSPLTGSLLLRTGGISLIIFALLIYVAAMIAMGDSWRIGIDTHNQGTLVKSGIFALSRNPVFVGFIAYYWGTALLHPSGFFIFSAAIFPLLIHRQILAEEKHLSGLMGREYISYRDSVPRYMLIRTGSVSNETIGYTQAGISIVANLLLFILKFWAGTLTGSIAIIADAWHTLSDSVSSVIVIAGIRISARKPSRRHPFGYGQAEKLAAIFIAFLLGAVAIELIRDSFESFRHPPVIFGKAAWVATLVSIAAKEGLAQYAFYCYRKTGLQTMRADAWHHRSDALSSVLVLAGIMLRPVLPWSDSILGILISLMLFYAAYHIVREAISRILGEEPPAEIPEYIRKMVENSRREYSDPHHFHLHQYGEHRELTFHLRFPNDTSVERAHRNVSSLEAAIREDLNISATIHIEPRSCNHEDAED